MKQLRGTLVLLAVAVGLGVYIFVVERKGPSSTELAEKEKRAVPRFDRASVTRITLERGAEKVVLRKDHDTWRIEEPVRFPADSGAVESVLSAVEFLEAQRRIDGPAAQYGLDKPRARITLSGAAAAAPVALAVGGDDATGRNVYAGGAQGPILVVEHNLLDTLSKPLADLRDKRALVFDRDKIKSLALVGDAGRTVLERSGQSWSIAGEARTLASTERVDGILSKLQDLKATRFVAEGLADLGKYGLEGAPRSIEMDTGSVDTLLLGGACADHVGEIYAARKGKESVILCLKDEEAAALLPDPGTLRETKLLPLSADDVKRIAIESGGTKLVLEKKDDKWSVADPKGNEADADVVKKWIEDLGAFRADATVALDAQKQGLSRPARIEVEADGRRVDLSFGATEGGMRFVRRDQEPLAMKVHAEVSASVSPSPLAFRPRKLLSFSRYDVKQVTARGAVEEQAQKSDAGGWRIEKPAKLPGDDSVIDELCGALAELKAERFVADTAEPAHGLGQPARVITATVEPPPGLGGHEEDDDGKKKDEEKGGKQTHTLEIGGTLPDKSCYARLDKSGPVFVLAEATCKTLRAPLVARKLFDLEEDKIVGFVLRRGAEDVTLEKRGPDWYRTGGARLEPSKIEDLLGAIRNARAKDVLGYGPDPIASPRLVLTVKTDAKPDQTLVAGKPAGDGLAARLAGRDVNYLVDTGLVESLERLTF
jgi:uncharacterized protein DUF4340